MRKKQLPRWNVKLRKLSRWIDNTFFPLPPTPKFNHEAIEEQAALIRDCIDTAYTIPQFESCATMILLLKKKFPNNLVADGWVNYLTLRVNNHLNLLKKIPLCSY